MNKSVKRQMVKNPTSTGIVQVAHNMDGDLSTKWPLQSPALKQKPLLRRGEIVGQKHRRILRGSFLLTWSSQVSPGWVIPPSLVWGGCISERKGLAAPGMVLGRCISPANSSLLYRTHRGALGHRALGALVLHAQLYQWHKAGLQLELPSRNLPPRPPPSRGSTAEAGMTLTCLYYFWTED